MKSEARRRDKQQCSFHRSLLLLAPRICDLLAVERKLIQAGKVFKLVARRLGRASSISPRSQPMRETQQARMRTDVGSRKGSTQPTSAVSRRMVERSEAHRHPLAQSITRPSWAALVTAS